MPRLMTSNVTKVHPKNPTPLECAIYLFISFSLQGCSDRVPGDGDDGVAENEDTLVTGGWVGCM